MNKISLVKKDFKKNWLVILILCVGITPDIFNGYAPYLLFLLFPLGFKNQYWDGKTMTAFLFGLVYISTMVLSGFEISVSLILYSAIYPILLLQAGRFLGDRFIDTRSSILLIVLMTLCIAFPAILDCIQDTVETGQLINIKRSLFENGEKIRGATGYGMMLSLSAGLIGLILIPTSNTFDKWIKILCLILSLLAIFSTVHLLNRTGLALSLISILIVLVKQKPSAKQFLYTVLLLVTMAILYYLYFADSVFVADAIIEYANRDSGIGSVSSLSGRDIRYLTAIETIFEHPFVSSDGIDLRGNKTFAHNLWLDGGLRGGIVSMILLIILSCQFVKIIYQSFKSGRFSNFESLFLLLIGCIMIAQEMVEPVLEGLPQLFWFMMFILGTLTSIYSKRQTKEPKRVLNGVSTT